MFHSWCSQMWLGSVGLLCSTESCMDLGCFLLMPIHLLSLRVLPKFLGIYHPINKETEGWSQEVDVTYHPFPHSLILNIVTWSHLIARQAGKYRLPCVTHSFVSATIEYNHYNLPAVIKCSKNHIISEKRRTGLQTELTSKARANIKWV